MKRKYFYFAGLLFALLVSLVSCSKGTIDDDDDPEIDPEIDQEYMEICKNAAKVHQQVLEIYDECNSIEELEEQKDKVKNIENVEDVYFTSSSMFVDIKDFRTVSYSFYPDPEPISEEAQEELVKQIQSLDTRMTRSDGTELPVIEKKKVGIFFQQYDDEKWADRKLILNALRGRIAKMGFDIGNDLLRPAVWLEDDNFAGYDIVFLNTHGQYDKKKGLHWLLTSTTESDKVLQLYYEFYWYANNQVSFDTHTELRNGKKKSFTYWKISDNYIKDRMDGRFKDDAIIFNSANSTMKGKEQGDTVGFSMAKAFCSRGAGSYLGYDEENSVNVMAGSLFLCRLLSGMSVKNAFETLPYEAVHNRQKTLFSHYYADLIPHYSPSESQKSTCFKPLFLSEEHNYTENGFFSKLTGTAFLNYYFIDIAWLKDEWTVSYSNRIPGNSPMQYGFELCESNDFITPISIRIPISSDNCIYNEGLVKFDYTLYYNQNVTTKQIKPKTHYYVRAYFYDGYSKYYSETKEFTTLQLKNGDNTGQGNLPDVPGTDF